ncbi:MAG: hypothetical protein QME96_18315 [Myxococcota bacterium]|nr:hypothetical protein [Myxococcota bacterium]
MKAIATMTATVMLAAGIAGAVEIHPSDWGRPDRVIHVHPDPVYHVYHPVPVVRITPPVVIDVRPDPDPFGDLGLVEVGAGIGGFYMPSLRESLLLAPRAHLGLVLDPVSVNLDVSVASELQWGPLDADGSCEAERGCGAGRLVQTSLGFAWRWNRRGVLHPTAGAGLELASLDPDAGPSSFAFTAAVSVGLIFEYPLPSGALEVGLDTTAHVKVASQDAYPLGDTTYLTFGGYVGYRF